MGVGNNVELICLLRPGSDVNFWPVYANVQQGGWSGQVIQLKFGDIKD